MKPNVGMADTRSYGVVERWPQFTILSMLVLAICFLLNGCYYAPIAKGRLERVKDFSDVSRLGHKPSVYLELVGRTEFRNAVTQATERSGLFTSFTFDSSESETIDYKIRIEASTREESPSIWRILLTWPSTVCAIVGITPFGVPLPTPYDSTYTLMASLYDRTGNTIGSYNIEESVMWWCGWSLILLAPILTTSDERLWEKMVEVLYQRMLDEGVIVYRGEGPGENELHHNL